MSPRPAYSADHLAWTQRSSHTHVAMSTPRPWSPRPYPLTTSRPSSAASSQVTPGPGRRCTSRFSKHVIQCVTLAEVKKLLVEAAELAGGVRGVGLHGPVGPAPRLVLSG